MLNASGSLAHESLSLSLSGLEWILVAFLSQIFLLALVIYLPITLRQIATTISIDYELDFPSLRVVPLSFTTDLSQYFFAKEKNGSTAACCPRKFATEALV